MDRIARVISYIEGLHDFRVLPPEAPPTHIGAVLVDAALQAGLNYDNVVKPRVEAVEAIVGARTAKGFLELLAARGAESVLSWSPGRKPRLVVALTELLVTEGVDTVDDLRAWLQNSANISKLSSLHGVGPKTVDYLKSLAGLPSVAIDVHLERFLHAAGVSPADYHDGRSLIEGAADRMGIDRTALDYSIWYYMAHPSGV